MRHNSISLANDIPIHSGNIMIILSIEIHPFSQSNMSTLPACTHILYATQHVNSGGTGLLHRAMSRS